MLIKDKEGKRWSLQMTVMNEDSGLNGVITEKASGELLLSAQVDAKVKCVAKNYKMNNEQLKGFFEREHQVLIKKVNIDTPDFLLQRPYIYQLKDDRMSDAYDANDEDDEMRMGKQSGKKVGKSSVDWG